MPVGIGIFSFDLFGITRRLPPAKPDDPREPSKLCSRDGASEDAERARDREPFFWDMFPVL